MKVNFFLLSVCYNIYISYATHSLILNDAESLTLADLDEE